MSAGAGRRGVAIRPPGDWESLTEDEKTAWVGAVFADIIDHAGGWRPDPIPATYDADDEPEAEVPTSD